MRILDSGEGARALGHVNCRFFWVDRAFLREFYLMNYQELENVSRRMLNQ